MPKFIHLHTHSHYSLLDGLAKIKGLINKAKELKMDSLAITDHGNLYGAIEFYQEANKQGIKPILGVEIYLAPASRFEKNAGKNEDKYFHLTLLAENNDGWQNLIKLVTKANLEGFYYKPRIDKELLKEYSKGLIALSGCPKGEVPQLILNNKFEEAEKAALEYQGILGKENFFLEIGHHPNVPEVQKTKNGIIEIHKKTGIPLVATQDIHYLSAEDAHYQDILLAVQTGNKLSDDDRLTLKADDFSMFSSENAMKFFKDFPEAIENTSKIADRCNVKLELGKILLPEFPIKENISSIQYLRNLINEKFSQRYPNADEKTRERLEYELNVIEKTKFADYFLIVQDIINWAKNHGIVVGPGRGSAAGSIISYILGITDLDPLKYDLLFERFLNPERIAMPDIDIDFADKRRDEVFAYVRQKYGEDKVAQIITFGTMAARGAVRDATRALGLPYALGDQIAKLIPFNIDLGEAVKNIKELKELYENNQDAKKVIEAAEHLEGVARHASVHACGVVISKEPLTSYVPLQFAPQDPNTIITQFEMGSIEAIGLLKMDFLGLKNLTIIEETIRLIKDLKNEQIDILKIPLDDKETFNLLQKGETVSVFQLESDGMRRYLKELKPTEFEDIIAMNALYRPGAMEYIPTYIKRKHGLEEIKYLHPKLEPILKNTYGIGVYQEQMMRIARDLAGFTLPEADTLRKAIGKKIQELLNAQKEKLINGMLKNGIDEKTAQKIWELFPPFAKYGFNRCLTGDTIIIDSISGEPVKMEEFYKNKKINNKIFSLEKNYKINTRPVADVFYNDKKPVFSLATKSGRTIKATANHPFLTSQGWKNLENIKIQEKIAVARIIPQPINPISIERHKIGLLGYLLAEGNFCHPNGFYFYSKSEKEINDYLSFLEKFENTEGKIDKRKSAIAVYAKRKNRNQKSDAVAWIESLGLKNKKATEKFFPKFIYQLSNNDMALLIGKMFQGDGCINTVRKDPQIFYATSSTQIAKGLQHLLLRFGILSTIHKKKFKYRDEIKIGYAITINRYDNIQKFIQAFGDYFVGEKSTAVKKILLSHPIINGNIPYWSARGSYDTIPKNLIIEPVKESIYGQGLNLRRFSEQTGIAERLFFNDNKKIGYLRETVGVIAKQLNNPFLLSLSESDIYWDEIVKIEFAGIEDTFDLSIDETHNFIANDIVVHNSHAACYALIAYQTAYLKAHYPIEFTTSLFNADSGNIERIAFLINEMKKMDINVLAPNINKSFIDFTPEKDAASGKSGIRFGLLAIKNVGANIAEAIINERLRSGPFQDFNDFLNRVTHKDLNKKSLESLIKAGVFDSLQMERGLLLANMENILSFSQDLKKSAQSQNSLFGANYSKNSLVLKPSPTASVKEKLAWEKELVGLYISEHPLSRYGAKLKEYKTKSIKEIKNLPIQQNQNYGNDSHRIAGVLASIKKIVTKNGQPMIFAKIADLDDNMEIIIFSDTLAKNPNLWQENNVLIAEGRLSYKDNEPKLVVQSAVELE